MSVKVRDLDYVNPRHKLPSSALPPEVRSRLGLAPAARGEDVLGEALSVLKRSLGSQRVLDSEGAQALAVTLNRLQQDSVELRALLQKHGWQPTGFQTAPDQQQLMHDVAEARGLVCPGLKKSHSTGFLVMERGIREKLARGGQSDEVYVGASNVAVVSAGAAGAGSDWSNPNGHAFVRRGTAQQRYVALQERAKEQRIMSSIRSSRRL